MRFQQKPRPKRHTAPECSSCIPGWILSEKVFDREFDSYPFLRRRPPDRKRRRKHSPLTILPTMKIILDHNMHASSVQRQQGNIATGQNKMRHIISVIQEMKNKESTAYRPLHYLQGTVVTPHHREKLCQWGYNLADASQIDRSIATVTITYFDRYLSCRGLKLVEICLASLREFQLAFVVSRESRN